MKQILRLVALVGVLVLAACGGGGGDSGSTDNSWLTFTPSTINVSQMEGTTQSFDVTASSTKVITQTLYIRIVDAAGVTDGTVSLLQTGNTTFVATMATSADLAPGTYDGSLTVGLYTDPAFTQVYPGSPWHVPYHIVVGARHTVHQLLADRRGVALVAFPQASDSRLSTTVHLADNLGLGTTWQATASQPWLHVRAAGTVGDGTDLTVDVVPDTLPLDRLSAAHITIQSSDPTVVGPEIVRVGVWRSSTAPAVHTSATQLYEAYATDPVAPYLYASAGAGTIDILNAYTGGKVATLDAGAGARILTMTVAPDGQRLYAVDSSAASRIVVFDLATRTVAASFAHTTPFVLQDFCQIQAVRANGHDVLMVQGGQALDPVTGAELHATQYGFGGNGSMAWDNARGLMYTLNAGISPPTIGRWSIDWIDYGGGSLEITQAQSLTDYDQIGIGGPLALTPDGSQIYAGWLRLSTADFTKQGTIAYGDQFGNSLRAVFVGLDGRAYATYGYATRVYGADGAPLVDRAETDVVDGAGVTADGVVFAVRHAQGWPYLDTGYIEFKPF